MVKLADPNSTKRVAHRGGAVLAWFVWIMLAGLLSVGLPVLAQATATVTAPSVYDGLVITNTPIAPISELDCPVGTPGGWGTTTPGALWEALCAPCWLEVTPTVGGFPTYDFGGLLTQQACQTVAPGGEECYWDTPVPTSSTPSTVTPVATGTGTVVATGTYQSCVSTTQTALPTSTPVNTPTTAGQSTVQFTLGGAWSNSAGWSNTNEGSCSGANCVQTSTTNAWIRTSQAWNGVGTLTVYVKRAADQGKYSIKGNGNWLVRDIDNYSSSTQFQYSSYSWVPAAGTYYIEFWNEHVKNASSSNYYTDFDYYTYSGYVPSTATPQGTFTPWPGTGAMTCAISNMVCEQWGSVGIHYTGAGNAGNMNWTDSISQGSAYLVRVVTDGSSMIGEGNATFAPQFTNSGGTTLYDFPEHVCGTDYCTDAGTYEFYAGNDAYDAFQWRVGLYGFTIGAGTEVWITPTRCIEGATPTSVPGGGGGSGYCGSIAPTGDSGFSYGGITYGAKICIDVGPYDWSEILPVWMGNIADILPEIPYLAHICFQDMSLGTATLFGLVVELQAVFLVSGIATIIALLINASGG